MRSLLATLLILVASTAWADPKTSPSPLAKIPGVDFMKPGPTPPPPPASTASPTRRPSRKKPSDSGATPNVGAGAFGGSDAGVNPYGKVQVGF